MKIANGFSSTISVAREWLSSATSHFSESTQVCTNFSSAAFITGESVSSVVAQSSKGNSGGDPIGTGGSSWHTAGGGGDKAVGHA
jgi:hypothetical protein